jgi:general secretion pathway protein K
VIPARPEERKAGGFALILVVWMLVLIGAIGTYLVANGRSEVVQARNVGAAASAEALADAAIARTVFNQTDPTVSNRWKLDGTAHQIVLPSGTVEIHLADETQKINPNLASNILLAALFQSRGVEQGAARRLGDAVVDWVKEAKDNAPASDPYRAAGRSYSAPHAPVESLDELGLVLGMTPEILASVRPYLTIYTGVPAPEAKTAPAVIQRAIALAARISPDDDNTDDADSATAQSGTLPQAQAAPAQAGAKQSSSEERLIEANIIARSRNGGVFVRYAVLRLNQENGKAYSVLDWRRGVLNDQGSGS